MQKHTALTVRALPRYLPPIPGETFASYLDRLAHALGVPIITALRATGIISEESEKEIGPGYGVTLSSTQLRTFAHATHLDGDCVAEMLLEHYHGRVINLFGLEPDDPTSFRMVALREWAYFSGSHLCPKCAEEDKGAWQLAWKLPWSFACVKHRTLLIDTCPRCRRRTGLSRQDGASRPRFVSKVPLPGCCMNAEPAGMALAGRSSSPCGQPLALISTESLAAWSTLLAAQHKVNDALENEFVFAGGVKTSTLTYFAELRSLAALLLYAAKTQDLKGLPPFVKEAFATLEAERDARVEERRQLGNQREGPHTRVFSSAPQSAAVMAAILPTAVNILAAPSPDGLAAHLDWLVERGAERKRNKVRQLADYLSFSPRLREALEQCLEPRKTFVRRLEESRRQLDQADGANSYSFTSDHVPQLLWQETYRQHFAELIPGVGEDYARRACAMALVRLSGNYTWREAAEVLELPPEPAYGMANKVVGVLNRTSTADLFAEQLRELAAKLSEDASRTDYGFRRRVFADFIEIEWRAWCLLCQRAGVPPGSSGGRQRYAAVWVWCYLTGGDYRLAPGLQGKNAHNFREVYRRFLKGEQPNLERELILHANNLLRSMTS